MASTADLTWAIVSHSLVIYIYIDTLEYGKLKSKLVAIRRQASDESKSVAGTCYKSAGISYTLTDPLRCGDSSDGIPTHV